MAGVDVDDVNAAIDRWADLDPDPAMIVALDRADAGGLRANAVTGTRELRNNWSNRFADACAVMVADEIRRHVVFRGLVVRPESDGPGEPLTFAAGEREKKVDVVVSSIVSGLQVGFSLKGMNFRDTAGLQFDKNLTGRTYELQDEVSVIHRYQPASFLVALYFMPLAATSDKRSSTSPSSFARTVSHLRSRTGRLDATLPGHMDRVDMAAVALYVPGDVETIRDFEYADDIARGVVRYFDVVDNPPRRGRPRVASTLDLRSLVDRIVDRWHPEDLGISWADPET
jgi:hypothetical protein